MSLLSITGDCWRHIVQYLGDVKRVMPLLWVSRGLRQHTIQYTTTLSLKGNFVPVMRAADILSLFKSLRTLEDNSYCLPLRHIVAMTQIETLISTSPIKYGEILPIAASNVACIYGGRYRCRIYRYHSVYKNTLLMYDVDVDNGDLDICDADSDSNGESDNTLIIDALLTRRLNQIPAGFMPAVSSVWFDHRVLTSSEEYAIRMMALPASTSIRVWLKYGQLVAFASRYPHADVGVDISRLSNDGIASMITSYHEMYPGRRIRVLDDQPEDTFRSRYYHQVRDFSQIPGSNWLDFVSFNGVPGRLADVDPPSMEHVRRSLLWQYGIISDEVAQVFLAGIRDHGPKYWDRHVKPYPLSVRDPRPDAVSMYIKKLKSGDALG